MIESADMMDVVIFWNDAYLYEVTSAHEEVKDAVQRFW